MESMERSSRKVRTGIVVSDARESFEAKVGDTVKIMETKPFSKTKKWRVTEVVERAR